ncbi:plasmid mobilization relaxosome protein MobC [Dyadobacter luteus]|uniref:Plasmid mobilization relaxosome protein MobC n=1 Tax=Dyadobacter luteus TaxID=2259619 RepID=A0A3D8Y688_9BACT|nr:plasmid mobilization relaxosome protein MobC [Dyadobacter luteus]REA58207.1 plasmid mobilization relaxosome protein MobC [Dyadobacter luteus]
MKQKSKKDRWLHVRLSQDEYEEIKAQFNATTCRKLSDFIRKKLLSQLIVGSYRSASQDAMIEELATLKAELSAAGNNFNQAVKKLHTLSKIKEFEHWLISYELDRRALVKQVEKAAEHISKKAAEW